MIAVVHGRRSRKIAGTRGVSLLELMVVVAIIIVVAAIGGVSLFDTLQNSHVTNGYNMALMALRRARETSISERRIYIVTFNPTGSPAGTVTITNSNTGLVVYTGNLPTDVAFDAEPNIPGTVTATPDGLGVGAPSGAICFDVGVTASGTNAVYFYPDGSARDANGILNSGVIYIAQPGKILSSRAITVLGATGRIRGWQIQQNASSSQYYWVSR